MFILYSFIAIFIGWIWIDYYRLIEIYDRENLKYFLLTYFLGGVSVLIVLGIDTLLNGFPFELNGTFINDFSYSVFKIGLVEEFAKLIPFLIIYFLFKKQFNEPIDFLAFISISALGFSAAENALYFIKGGAEGITSRAILSAVGHMFDTSIIAYGIIIVKFKNKQNSFFTLIGFFFLAALSHGFYDFWLLYAKGSGWIITIFYFFITISIFATILNNAINNSTFFTYKKVIDSNKVAGRLLTYYAIIFIAQFIIIAFKKDINYAVGNFIGTLCSAGFIIVIAVVRLSRFKLIQGRWQKIKIELPFSMSSNSNMAGYSSPASAMNINIKGDSFNEVYINAYYEEYFYLFPVSTRIGEIDANQLTYIEKKLFLKNDETFYLAKLFKDDSKQIFESRLLKPKTRERTMMYEKYPIVAILKIDNAEEITNVELSTKDFEFQEWAYIKPSENKN